MRRLLTILLLLTFALTLPAQRQTTKQRTRQPSQKEQLQQKQKKVAEQRKANQQRQRELEQQVKKRMQDVEALGSSIDDNRLAMERLALSIDTLNRNIAVIDSQLTVLQNELEERRQHYIKSVRYMYRSRNAQKQLMFVLSAKNFNQMYRRMRFMNEYTTYQRAQGEAVKQKGEQVSMKRQELDSARIGLNRMLAKGQAEQRQMEMRQAEQQHMVADLQKQQQTVKKLITQQQQEEAALNQQIEKLIAQEIERARKAEEERQRQLAEQRRREQELAAQQQASSSRRSSSSSSKISLPSSLACFSILETTAAAPRVAIIIVTAVTARRHRLLRHPLHPRHRPSRLPTPTVSCRAALPATRGGCPCPSPEIIVSSASLALTLWPA